MAIQLRRWLALGGATLGALGAGIALRSFLPLRLPTEGTVERRSEPWDGRRFPDVTVNILRCGSTSIPACFAVRGTFSLAPRELVHSAILIRHPRGTFLYDTGLCADIELFLLDQPWLFRKTLATFTMEQPVGTHLQQLLQYPETSQKQKDASSIPQPAHQHGSEYQQKPNTSTDFTPGMQPSNLDFVILSHLHWDHVSGVPDLPGVPLRVNRVEYDTAQEDGLLDAHHELSRRLLGDNNPLEFFELTGPAYAGFPASLDLFGDGSIVLVPLPGHTRGQVGMFIHRNNGAHLLLIGDAAWLAENYLNPAPMHPLFWWRVTGDDALARQTLVDLHHFARRHPEIPLIAMHDGRTQRAFMLTEETRLAQPR